MVKKFDELTFTDDFMFCKAMTEDISLCEEITGLILGKPVKIVIPPEKQKAVNVTADGKGVRFDVHFTDNENTIYDIEMQTGSLSNLEKRSRYYQGMIDLNELKQGMDYTELPNSIIIFICLFDLFKANEPIYTFTRRCLENPDVFLNDGSKIIFVNSKGDLSKTGPKVGAFLSYLEGKNQQDELTQKIDETVQKIREQQEWRLQYMSLLERDAINRAEGKIEGIEEGIEIGTNKANREVSLNLASMGFPENKIAEIVKVPVEIVSQWLSNISPA